VRLVGYLKRSPQLFICNTPADTNVTWHLIFNMLTLM